jgi:hypothetical protein
MKGGAMVFAALAFLVAISGCDKGDGGNAGSPPEAPTSESRAKLATCLTDKGWVMYGSFTCSACRAQRKAFGETFTHIKEIECNAHAPNTQVDLCLAKGIETTPTWIQEKGGEEIKRLEGYQLLEDLASVAGCDL